MNYESQIRNDIKPNLGDVPLLVIVHDPSERLETFYARLRHCRQLCSGRPFAEEHSAATGPRREQAHDRRGELHQALVDAPQ